jgi:uncharacterized membrane protein
MLPDPLHPAVVHFPIALALLAPFLIAGLLYAIRSGRSPARAWVGVLVLQAVVAGSAWLAVETGEDEEDRVERVVAEAPIEAHEEAAERFLVLAGVAVVIAGVGLAGGTVGLVARFVMLFASLGLAWAVMDVGHRGGELVYRHGAASAYVDAGVPGAGARAVRHDDDHDDD